MDDQQTSNVLLFRRKRRRRRSKNDEPAQMLAFPPGRHKRIVAYVANQMREQASSDAAEEFLVDHLHLECTRLADLGIADDEIDIACQAFARAVWAVFLRGHDAEGVA
jgi:hypothetical protein